MSSIYNEHRDDGGGAEVVALLCPTILKRSGDNERQFVVMHECNGLG